MTLILDDVADYLGATTGLQMFFDRSAYVILPQAMLFIWVAIVMRSHTPKYRTTPLFRLLHTCLSAYYVQWPVSVVSLILSIVLYYLDKDLKLSILTGFVAIAALFVVIRPHVYTLPPTQVHVALWPAVFVSTVLSSASDAWNRPSLVFGMQICSYFLAVFIVMRMLTGSYARGSAAQNRHGLGTIHDIQDRAFKLGKDHPSIQQMLEDGSLERIQFEQAKAFCIYYARIPAYDKLGDVIPGFTYVNRLYEIEEHCSKVLAS